MRRAEGGRRAAASRRIVGRHNSNAFCGYHKTERLNRLPVTWLPAGVSRSGDYVIC